MTGPAAERAHDPGAVSRPPRMSGRARRRRLWFGLLTVLGASRRGFFIPHRYAARLPAAGRRPPYRAVEALFAGHRGRFREVLGWIDAAADGLLRIGGQPAPAPRWDQSWFPRLDAATAYALVRRFAPRLIVEVGCGHSTRFLTRAVADAGIETRIVAIDPAPRADPSGLPVELRRATVQDAGAKAFSALGPGDLLFIDSSHVLMPGSDVDFLLGRVLPALPAGVLVQVHDIFLPDDYPAAWDWRGYNEQLGVQPLLLGGRWEVVFASHYVATRMADALRASVAGRLPLPAGACESSLWLRAR
ncbi:MAG: class I SAM-dependent methyltransferase [Kiloniellaceae bacterium]